MKMSVRFRAELSSWQEQVRARFAALELHGAMTAGEQSKGSADSSGPSACPRVLLHPQGSQGD